MRTLYSFLLILLATLGTAMPCAADEVHFVSGEDYQIRCILWPDGCVTPSATNDKALVYSRVATDNNWWTITCEKEGVYVIRNASNGRYFTYDGERTDDRRYMYLSTTDHGDASRWSVYVSAAGLGVRNLYRRAHYLDVRKDSYIVGTYSGHTDMLSDNERFFLVNRKGEVVTHFDQGFINLPDDCFEGRKRKAPTLAGRIDALKKAGTKAAAQSTPANTSTRAVVQASALNFTVDGRRPVYDSRSQLYYCAVSDPGEGSDVVARMAVENAEKGELYIDGKVASRKGKCHFPKPDGGHVFRLALVSGSDTVARAKLTFTYLPIIEITAGSMAKSSFNPGTFRLSDPSGRDVDSTLSVKMRYRGDYATFFSKKSFAVKFVDSNGKKQSRKWLDMRTDNYWILDAMAVDHARMRNRVAMDLWNDMDVKPYYASSTSNLRTGVEGRLVEVFYNGRYQGVYNFTERIDRKQLQLKKSEGDKVYGCLYKSRQWDTWTLLGFDRSRRQMVGSQPPGYDNRSESWGKWEVKYPEIDKNTSADWRPLYEAILVSGAADDATFCNKVGTVYDLPAVRDYYLFIELLHAVDNSGKNMYWAVYDQTKSKKLTPAPWDLDGTFGRGWDGHRSGCEATNPFRDFLRSGGMQNALFERLYKLDPDGWNKQMANRYRELRRSLFSPENLMKRFTTYRDLLKRSGAERREVNQWHNANGIYLTFDDEMDFLKKWIADRVAFLDKQYGL